MSFESWVRDLEAVVDACGIERFPLLGLSQGAAIALFMLPLLLVLTILALRYIARREGTA